MSACGPDDGDPVIQPPPYVCGPSNCAGCCHDNVCQTGNKPQACGTAGSNCQACQQGESCYPGSQPLCRVDFSLTSTWTVQPVSSLISAQDPNDGLSWDADASPPDVIVEILCPTDGGPPPPIASTKTEVESYTPTWTKGEGGCKATLSAFTQNITTFRLIDVDAFVNDEISSGTYTFTMANFENGGVTLGMPNQASILTLKLVPQPQ